MDYSYYGRGILYIREAGAAAGLMSVGNAREVTFNVQEQVEELPDYTQPGGGTYNEVRRIESVEARILLHDLSPANVARALLGTSSPVAGAAVTNEEHVAYLGAFIPLEHPGPYTAITMTDDGTTPAGIPSADNWEIRPGGIYILPDAQDIDNGDTVAVNYTHAGYDRIQAITQSAREYEMVFAGLNEARSGKEVRVNAYRVKLGPTEILSLITEGYGELPISGKVLKDLSITGGSLSQYFRVDIVE